MYLQKKNENSIQKYKLVHFCVGLLLAQLPYLWIWFLLLPVMFGFGKDLYDKYVRNTESCYLDWSVTSLGCMSVAVMILDGVSCIVLNNRINGATGHSLDLRGNNNIVSNNQLYADDSCLITGNNNKLKDCDITSKSAYSIEVSGNGNIIDSCTTDKPIRIVSGNGNRAINCISTSAIKVIINAGCTNTVLVGFATSEVTDNGTGTIFR